MYLICLCGYNKFSLEKIYFLKKNFFLIFILISGDSFCNNKLFFCCLKLFSLKKNELFFQFKKYYIYNNFLIYNNYIFFKILNFEKIFVILSDYGLFFNNIFINYNYFVSNFHISLLPFFNGLNPSLGINFFLNIFFGFTVFSLNKQIDKGKNIYFYKLYKKYNLNYFIIKYNSSLICSLIFNNFYKKIFYNFLFFFNQFFYYKYVFNMTK
ncbi:Phosphoribosylglycinamide formyltransferase [Candidatus Nasuia deltocephalinicola]|nr:Phosphoribosylglycinamide formyltransferase [Candidatus Nasuia deltocephalinicola]